MPPSLPGVSGTIRAEKLLLQEEPLGGVFSAARRPGICLFADATEVVCSRSVFVCCNAVVMKSVRTSTRSEKLLSTGRVSILFQACSRKQKARRSTEPSHVT